TVTAFHSRLRNIHLRSGPSPPLSRTAPLPAIMQIDAVTQAPACATTWRPRAMLVAESRISRLAFAPDPGAVGQNVLDAGDADGRYFGREMMELARSAGMGWVDFK